MIPPVKGQKVSSTESLYRRAYIDPVLIKYRQGKGVHLKAFKLRLSRERKEDALSVDVAGLTTKERALPDSSTHFLLELAVRDIELLNEKSRSFGEESSLPELEVLHDPEEDNSAHALITGMDETNHDLVAKELCKLATVIGPNEPTESQKGGAS